MAVVTISRQTGSKGDEIAALLAKKLNHELIDDEKIHSLAESCDDEYKDANSSSGSGSESESDIDEENNNNKTAPKIPV